MKYSLISKKVPLKEQLKRIYDSVIGILGTVTVFLLMAILISDQINKIDANAMARTYFGFLIICIFAIVFFFIKKRKCISFGIIATIAFPTLIFMLSVLNFVTTGKF